MTIAGEVNEVLASQISGGSQVSGYLILHTVDVSKVINNGITREYSITTPSQVIHSARHEEMGNVTALEGFIFLGITDEPDLQIFLFVIFLVFYLFILSGNLGIFLLITIVRFLHKPMYFFLANLSFLDIFYSTTTVPKMLSGLLIGYKSISFLGCITQLHIFHFLAGTEAFLLAAMSYDRYVAICNPLRYHALMGRTSCIHLASSCWLLGFVHAIVQTFGTFRLPYCNRKEIAHFYCDVKPVMKLACADTTVSEMIVFGNLVVAAGGTFLLIIVSYMFIGRHLLNIRCGQERQKAFFTCTSHITVVFLYFVSSMCMYLGPNTQVSLDQDRITAILVTIITPVLNPLIYTLRNKEIKRAVQRKSNDPSETIDALRRGIHRDHRIVHNLDNPCNSRGFVKFITRHMAYAFSGNPYTDILLA
ncbi:olfactory receptor 10G4-like [Leptodactylus fuscus]|uniref:olfactory receptor 10G4-like n=1 Tax=Leptodactylus fuscus TaxID=238119 RepID=UPI003F4EEEC7